MGWPSCCFRNGPAYKKVDADPAQYVSARLESEYDADSFQLKNTVSSLYRKVSEWSLPKIQKVNLFTMNEAEHHEHDFLIDENGIEGENVELEFPGNDVQHFSRPKKHTVSSIYNKTDTKLSTVHEREHESLMDEYTPPSPSTSSPPPKLPDFGDVVDEMV